MAALAGILRDHHDPRVGLCRFQELSEGLGADTRMIGRLQDGALVFDLRCLEDEATFLAQLDRLVVARKR